MRRSRGAICARISNARGAAGPPRPGRGCERPADRNGAMIACSMGYEAFAADLIRTGVLSDPWLEGQPRFRVEPLVLSAAEHQALCRAAEDMAAVSNQLALICTAEPALATRYFGLTPFQRAMWAASAP